MFRVYSTSVKKYTARRKTPDGLYYTVYFVAWLIKYFNQKYKTMRNSALPHTLNSFNSFSAIQQFCPSLYNNHEQSHTQWSVPQQAPQVQYTYITQHSPLNSAIPRLSVTQIVHVWRYVGDWAPHDTAWWVATLSHRTVVKVSSSCRLLCWSSRFERRVESYHELILSNYYRHLIWNVFQYANSIKLTTFCPQSAFTYFVWFSGSQEKYCYFALILC